MLNPEDKEKLQNMIKMNWHIFRMFTGAVILYTAVLFVVTRFGSSEPRQGDGVFDYLLTVLSQVDGRVLKSLFIVASVILGALKFLIQGKLWLKEDAYRNCQTLDKIMGRYGQYFFIILALCQAVPLLGMVLVFMTGRMDDWWLFFGITVVLFGTSAPRAGKVESIVQAHATRVETMGSGLEI